MDVDLDTTAQTAIPPPELRQELAAERRLRETPKCTVLVVDDDEGIRTAMAQVLELLGYDVASASDGLEASQLLGLGLEPQAIVLDMMMPRMDGWTFLSRLRSDPRHQEIPVIVASAVVSDRPTAADGWLQKPFDLIDLDREVARLVAH